MLLIATYLTSIVVPITRKLLKTTLKNVASIQIQKVATFNSVRKIINLIPNKSFRYYNQ